MARDKEKQKVYKRRYYEKNKERLSQQWKEFYQNNKERLQSKQAAQYRKNLPTYLFYAARARAKKLGVGFNLRKEDVVIPEVCPVFGVPLKQGHRDWAPSVDRINPLLGYVRSNICVISMRANRLKNDASLEEIEKIVSYMKTVEQERGRNLSPAQTDSD